MKSRYVRAFCGVALVLSLAAWSMPAHAQLDQWVQGEIPAAIQKMMVNSTRTDVVAGAVIAAPSQDPNYFYHWIRDAAITMDTVVSLFERTNNAQDKAAYYQVLVNYVNFSRGNQLTPNRSGDADNYGLGEPKFNVDGSAFMGDWGRPQNDGPALRSIALIRMAQDLITENNPDRVNFVHQRLYDGGTPSNSVIKNDLEYVAHHWQDPCYDLWEEVKGTHFFTQMVQRRAMVDGAILADRLGDSGAAAFYRQQAANLAQAIQAHWDPNRQILVETINLQSGIDKPSGLDSAVVIGVMRGGTPDRFMSPTDDRVLATADKIRKSFDAIYPINARVKDWENQPMGSGIGRYPEDTFDGGPNRSQGNPWFLATSAFAELYYQAANLWERDQVIPITAMNAPILQSLPTYTRGPVQAGEQIVPSDARFATLIRALRDSGDDELRRVHYHAGSDGSQWEEFNRNTGYMGSAADLTWSYAGFLTAAMARQF